MDAVQTPVGEMHCVCVCVWGGGGGGGGGGRAMVVEGASWTLHQLE